MSVAQQITPSDVRTYFSRTQPDWKMAKKQIHVPCPIHNGIRDSFSLNTATGQWMCNSDCGRGGDIVTLEHELRGGSIGEAITRVEEIIGTSFSKPKPFTGRGQSDKLNISQTYSYRDEESRELFQVVRLEPKSFRQRHMGPDGKWIWNLQDVRRVPYRLQALRLSTGPVFFVEGEKDADRLAGMGLSSTTSPSGAGNWREEYAQHFTGRNIWVIPDNDEPRDKGVRYPGQQHAAQVMRSLLKVARQVMLIDLTESGAKDVSDWIDKNGADNFGLLANCATPMTLEKLAKYELKYANTPEQEPEAKAPEPAEAKAAKPKAPKGKGSDGRHPNAIAEEILERHKVISWGRDSVWEYDGTIWRAIAPETVQQWALEAESAFATKGNRRREIANYILIKSRKENTPWRSLQEYEVPVLNGVVDLRDSSIRPHRAEDYLEAVMPLVYDPTATCEVWPRALQTAWKGDVDIDLKILALQEFMGYVLMAHAKYKKALLLYGQPDSGKSQILALLQGMVGKGNYCSISVKDMDDQRKLAPIRGKMLNALAELPHTALIADGGFKTLVSTGDAIQIDAKFEQPEQYVPYAKHVIVTNTLPRVNDLSDATFNRMLLLKFNRSLPVEERDVNLLDKLLAEAPGILNWAMEGAKRLYSRHGDFTVVPESVAAVQEYKRQSNSVNDFVHLYCRESEGNNIGMAEFRERLNVFRRDGALGLNSVRRMVKSALGSKACDDWTIFDYAWK